MVPPHTVTVASGTASWTSPSTGGLATVFDGTNLYLDASHSGALIYINVNYSNSLFNNASSLPDGFTCTLINVYSTSDSDNLYIYTSNNLFFFTIANTSYSSYYRSNASYFYIRPGGTVKVNVITISGQKRIYLTGDVID